MVKCPKTNIDVVSRKLCENDPEFSYEINDKELALWFYNKVFKVIEKCCVMVSQLNEEVSSQSLNLFYHQKKRDLKFRM